METVEVLVRIPKKDFEELQSNYVWWGKHGEYIKKGTVLPKGHGRLIDADAFNEELDNCDYDTYNDYSNTFDWIEEAPTVIEANKEDDINVKTNNNSTRTT